MLYSVLCTLYSVIRAEQSFRWNKSAEKRGNETGGKKLLGSHWVGVETSQLQTNRRLFGVFQPSGATLSGRHIDHTAGYDSTFVWHRVQ